VTNHDDVNCIDKSDLELADFLVETLVDVCDCVPTSMQKVYYNPAMLAASAMLLPNFLRVCLLLKKYALHFSMVLAKNFFPSLAQRGTAVIKDVWGDISGKIFVVVDVLALISNVAIGISAITDYFVSPALAPVGANICYSTHATFGVMYKPVVVSFFGAVVSVFDVVYWNNIELKPLALRRAMGHADHPANPSVDQNYIVSLCMAIVAAMYVAWASVSMTFLPLAVPFFVVVLVFGGCIPLFAIFGMSEMLSRAESALDKKFIIEGAKEKVDKSLLVKAILVQLISTVVLLASTSSFYLDQDWAGSFDRAVALLRALQYDFAFNVEFTFGWPKLPQLGAIQFALALSVLAFQLFVKFFIRLYYASGANTFGSTALYNALGQLKKSKMEDIVRANFNGAIIILHYVLTTALYVAIKMDSFVLKLTANRKFNRAEKVYINKREESALRLIEGVEETTLFQKEAHEVNSIIVRLNAEVDGLHKKLQRETTKLISIQSKLAKAPKTILELDRMHF
jgi:hypothetical protein